jgi:DNA modification methylase
MREEIIGDCRLILGDCRDVLPILERVDTVFTSPPYNCGIAYDGHEDKMPLAEFEVFLSDTVFCAAARAYVVNVGQYIGSRDGRVLFRDILMRAAAASGLPLVDEVLWDKGPANGAAWGNYPNSPRIRAGHESIYFFGDASMPNGNGLDWREWSRLTTSIWRVSANVDLTVHPAMMPVEVARRSVALWSDTAGDVLDPFMGSGTTGVACIMTGRRFVGVESSPSYFDIACRRIEEAYRQPRLFAEPAPKPVQGSLLGDAA